MSLPNAEKQEPVAPPTFEDGEGRTWQIKVTLALLDRLQEQLQFDMAPDDGDSSRLTGLLFETRRLADVLWCCIAKQAEAKGVSRDDFRECLDEDALTTGWGALVDAAIFFIRRKSPTMGEAFQETVEAQMRVIESGAKQITAAIRSEDTQAAMDRTAAEAGKQMQKHIGKELGKFATS